MGNQDNTETRTSSRSLDDLFRIRDIIFGEEMADYERRFAAIDARLQTLQEQLQTRDAQAQTRLQQTMDEFQQEIAELRSSLLAKIEELELKSAPRVDVGDMLIEIGQRLKRVDA